MRYGSKIRRVRLDQQPVVWNKPKQRVIEPATKGDDPAEGYVPTDVESGLREYGRAGIAVQHADDTRSSGPFEKGGGIDFGFARVQYDRTVELRRQRQLCIQRVQLSFAWRMIVVRVEPALTDGDGAVGHGITDRLRIEGVVPLRGIVWVNTRGVKHEGGKTGGDRLRAECGGGGLADTDKGPRSCCAGPLDHRARFISERGIGQMDVTICKDCHETYRAARRSDFRERAASAASLPAPTARLVASELVRGYLDSIQMSSGPAT